VSASDEEHPILKNLPMIQTYPVDARGVSPRASMVSSARSRAALRRAAADAREMAPGAPDVPSGGVQEQPSPCSGSPGATSSRL